MVSQRLAVWFYRILGTTENFLIPRLRMMEYLDLIFY